VDIKTQKAVGTGMVPDQQQMFRFDFDKVGSHARVQLIGGRILLASSIPEAASTVQLDTQHSPSVEISASVCHICRVTLVPTDDTIFMQSGR
jgi:hypothetical protein